MLTRDRSRGTRRRAATVVVAAMSVFMMFTFAVLAVDSGMIYFARGQMQRTADASALAGASGVVVRDAVPRAEAFAYINKVVTHPVIPSELQITIGDWNGETNVFVPRGDYGLDGVMPNAVRVVGTRPALGLVFAPILGRSFTQVRRMATAVSGAGQCAGIWGLEGITGNGGIVTDSYDPARGNYGPGNIRPNGDICSCQDITINGNNSIRGDAMYGDGYEFVANGESHEVWGMIDDQTCREPNITIDYAAAAADNDNHLIPATTSSGQPTFRGRPGYLQLVNDEYITLPPGTYFLRGLHIEGQAYIEITGPTTIYIDAYWPVTIGGGGLVNTTQDANNLIIYTNASPITYTGTATFYGAIIAPTSEFRTIGTFNCYGTVLARELTLGGDAWFHVDEGLVFSLFGISPVAPVLVE